MKFCLAAVVNRNGSSLCLLTCFFFFFFFLLLGINPSDLRGTKTGVWVGVSGSEAGEAFSRDPEELLGYSMTGCQRAMFANRISYFFDFKGKFCCIYIQ